MAPSIHLGFSIIPHRPSRKPSLTLSRGSAPLRFDPHLTRALSTLCYSKSVFPTIGCLDDRHPMTAGLPQPILITCQEV